jgi:hypothetical protein
VNVTAPLSGARLAGGAHEYMTLVLTHSPKTMFPVLPRLRPALHEEPRAL